MSNLREPLRHQTLAIYLFAGGIMLYTCTSIPMWAMFRFNIEHYPVIDKAFQRISNIVSMIRYAACGIGLILLADKQMPVVHHAIR